MDALGALLAVWGLRILYAAIILVVGRWAAGAVRSITQRAMEKSNADPILVKFVGSLVYIGLVAFVVIAALGKLEIPTASFVAVVGAAGLAIGLALQGSLANFASGVMLVIFRPFKVGDYIEGGGVSGIVEGIQIFNTLLRTPDNKAVIVPNSKVTGDNITNYSAKEMRRIDLVIGVGYEDDLKKVRQVIEEILTADDRILKDPEPTIGVLELADNSVNFAVRPWTRTDDYGPVHFDTVEKIKTRFDAEGITIPYPQRDVHLHQAA